MTTKTDLPPSSVAAFTEALKGGRGSLDAWLEVNDERDVVAHVEAYARANVAVATATLQAEIEALRKEVERLNRILGRIVEGDGDSTVAIRTGTDAFAAAREYLRPNT